MQADELYDGAGLGGAQSRDREPTLMTPDEVAAFFRVSRYTVLEWSRRGTLPSIVLHTGPSRSVRRWRRADVEALATPAAERGAAGPGDRRSNGRRRG